MQVALPFNYFNAGCKNFWELPYHLNLSVWAWTARACAVKTCCTTYVVRCSSEVNGTICHVHLASRVRVWITHRLFSSFWFGKRGRKKEFNLTSIFQITDMCLGRLRILKDVHLREEGLNSPKCGENEAGALCLQINKLQRKSIPGVLFLLHNHKVFFLLLTLLM